MRQLLSAIVSLAGGRGRPSAEEKPAANLRSKTRGTLPWEGSKVAAFDVVFGVGNVPGV